MWPLQRTKLKADTRNLIQTASRKKRNPYEPLEGINPQSPALHSPAAQVKPVLATVTAECQQSCDIYTWPCPAYAEKHFTAV